MKNIINQEEVRKKEKLSKDTVDKIALAEVAQALSFVNFTRRYKWIIGKYNLDVTQELELTNIKIYQSRCACQVEIELDWLYNKICIMATFVKYLRKVYNNKKVTKNIKVKPNMDRE